MAALLGRRRFGSGGTKYNPANKSTHAENTGILRTSRVSVETEPPCLAALLRGDLRDDDGEFGDAKGSVDASLFARRCMAFIFAP